MENHDFHIQYSKLFWLFFIGSLLGVLIEGLFCLIRFGHWETHVVSVWGPLCILYGIGAVGFYIGGVLLQEKNTFAQFAVFGAVGTGIEFICGWLMEHALHMYAWDYSKHFLNYHGYVSLKMFFAWGLLGTLFNRYVPVVDGILDKMQGSAWRVAAIVLSVLIVIDLSVTAVSVLRWSERHEGKQPSNRLEEKIDILFDDDSMRDRFCEWHFLDNRAAD